MSKTGIRECEKKKKDENMEIKLMQVGGGTCSLNARSDTWLLMARLCQRRTATLCVCHINLVFVLFCSLPLLAEG